MAYKLYNIYVYTYKPIYNTILYYSSSDCPRIKRRLNYDLIKINEYINILCYFINLAFINIIIH